MTAMRKRERNGQIKTKVVHVFLNIPRRSSFTILLDTVLLLQIIRWVMTEPTQQESRRFQCARKWRAMRLLGIYWWGVAAVIKPLQYRWNCWTSLACPTFSLLLYTANYSSWPLSSAPTLIFYILSYSLCLFFCLHYVDQGYCHVTPVLCSITLILPSALFLLLLGHTDIHRIIWMDTRCIWAV